MLTLRGERVAVVGLGALGLLAVRMAAAAGAELVVGADVAVELAGTYPALEAAIRCVRVGGTVCAAGSYQGESRELWLGREFHHNRLALVVPHGCGWGHPPRDHPGWDERRAYDAIVSLMRKGTLTAPGLVRPVVSLDEGPDVWRLIEHDPDRVIEYAARF